MAEFNKDDYLNDLPNAEDAAAGAANSPADGGPAPADGDAKPAADATAASDAARSRCGSDG